MPKLINEVRMPNTARKTQSSPSFAKVKCQNAVKYPKKIIKYYFIFYKELWIIHDKIKKMQIIEKNFSCSPLSPAWTDIFHLKKN